MSENDKFILKQPLIFDAHGSYEITEITGIEDLEEISGGADDWNAFCATNTQCPSNQGCVPIPVLICQIGEDGDPEA